MGLTKPRAYQIFDIDYKQAVKVVTLTDITLTGGAPNQVDGVNLSVNDRILVAGNTPASENGIYVVTVVGTGANGTWTRSVDADQTGEIQAGMIVMVTEGNLYDDTQWKLTTDDPITVGITALNFEQSSAYAFGTISVSGQSDIVADSVGDTLNIAAGNNIALTTTPGTDTLTIAVTGISLNSISNGTSNVNVVSSGGNVTVGVGGTGNVAVFATTGEYITGVVSATGNITGDNLLGTTVNGNLVGTTASLSANVIGGNILTGGLVSASGTITGANISGSNFLTSGLISATATITGGNLQTAGTISATGNITGGNVTAATFTGNVLATTVSSSSSITGGNLFTGGEISATGRIQGANITGGNLLTSGVVSATGNITGANILTGGLISATGNLTSGNLITGGLVSATGTISGGNVNVLSTGNVRYYESDNTNYVAFRAPAIISTNVVWTLPATDGTPNTVLTTDGTGTLSWTAGGGGTSSGGFFNSTLTTFPGSTGNADYGNGEAYVGAVQSSDAFGIPIIPNYDCTDPYGSLPATDLGSVA